MAKISDDSIKYTKYNLYTMPEYSEYLDAERLKELQKTHAEKQAAQTAQDNAAIGRLGGVVPEQVDEVRDFYKNGTLGSEIWNGIKGLFGGKS